MGLRAQANLTISFGLVNIGVSVQTLMNGAEVEAHTYNGSTKASLKQQMVDSATGELVDKLATVYGYEYQGKMVYLTDGDRRSCESENDKRIQLTRYVPVEDIDPLYFDGTYMLWPQKGHEDGFALIQAELRETGKALIGEVTLYKTTRMFVIRWSEDAGALLAHTGNFEARVRREHLAEVQDRCSKKADPAATAMVKTILDALDDEFDPAMVEDTYTKRLITTIEAKAKGKKIEPAKVEKDVPAPDIMAALRAEVAKAKPKAKKTTARKAPAKKPVARKRARA